MGRSRRSFFLQYRILQQVMLGEIVHSLCHLFQIKDLGPPHIPGTFSGLELCLDVKEQIDLRRICLLDRFLVGRMLLLTSKDTQQVLQGVAIAQAVQAGHFTPAGELQTVGFSALGHFTAGFPEQLQQLVQVSRLLCQSVVNSSTEQFPMGGLRLIAQPLVVTFAVGLWVLDNGQSVLNADGVAQSTDGFCAAPKVAELPVTVQVDRTPNDMIMDMGLINVGTDDKGVFALGEPLGKFHAQPVGVLRGDFPRAEGLADMVGDHIVCAPDAPGSGNVLALGQHKLGVGHTAVALVAGDELAVVCLLRIGHIVDNRADGTALGPALADMQRHDACGCHEVSLPSKKEQHQLPISSRYEIICFFFCLAHRSVVAAPPQSWRT